MNCSDLKPNYIIHGSIIPESAQAILITDGGVNHPRTWPGAILGEWRVV